MSLASTIAFAVERILDPVEGMHRAIAGASFAALGPLGNPVRSASGAVSRVVYGSIRIGAAAVAAGADVRPAVESSTADSAQALVNGLWGDRLGRREERLGTSMSIRDRQGHPIPLGPELAAAFPAPTGRIVVLVHGLIKTEHCWYGTDTKPGVIRSLDDRPALTPVAVRYNTGLPVAANGARLASLLESVHSQWPVPVRSMALVGHSMGGLVVRNACASARRAGHRWIDRTTDVITIGSPHRGAPLEKFTNIAASGLGVAAQTRPLADFLNTRSQGIKDLRFGANDHRATTSPQTKRGATAESSDIKHHFVAGVITADPAHPIGAVLGDLMVRPASSTRAPHLDASSVVVLGGVHHFDLLHAPAVIDSVVGWLDPPE